MRYRLAVMAGEWNVEMLHRRMTAAQAIGWARYFSIEPFGAFRDNYHAARIAKAVYDTAGWGKNTGKEPFTLEELLVVFGDEAPKKHTQSWQDKFAMAKMIAMAFNAPGRNA